MRKFPSKYCGTYIVRMLTGRKPPHYRWCVRELIPASASESGRLTYKNYYPPINTKAAAKELRKQVAAVRPKYARGNPHKTRKTQSSSEVKREAAK